MFIPHGAHISIIMCGLSGVLTITWVIRMYWLKLYASRVMRGSTPTKNSQEEKINTPCNLGHPKVGLLWHSNEYSWGKINCPQGVWFRSASLLERFMTGWWIFMKWAWLYAVKAQTSLAPLSRFCGSRITTAHEQQCCRFQSYAKNVPSPMKLTSKIDKAWTTFLGSTTTDHVITACDV